MSWSPQRIVPASDDTLMRLLDLYRHTDPALARALEDRVNLEALLASSCSAAGGHGNGDAGRAAARVDAGARLFRRNRPARRRTVPGARRTARASARSRFDGWDTHANEGVTDGRLAELLGALDGAIAAVETRHGRRLGSDTVVAIVTEFGRTARINGTEGTDHGTATSRAGLAGGALKGGRVIADWPGLKRRYDLLRGPRSRADDRSLRAVLKGVAA